MPVNYNHLAGFLQEELKRKVNREAELEYPIEPKPFPKYEETKVAPLSAGVYNLVKQFRP